MGISLHTSGTSTSTTRMICGGVCERYLQLDPASTKRLKYTWYELDSYVPHTPGHLGKYCSHSTMRSLNALYMTMLSILGQIVNTSGVRSYCTRLCFRRAAAPQLDSVDGPALEAPANHAPGDSSATIHNMDDPREALGASLTREEDGANPGDAHEQASLSPLEPVAGHLEREVASPETSVTENNRATANVGMASPTRSESVEEDLALNEQQIGVSEISIAATDIREEPAPSIASNSVGPSEAVAEKNAVGLSEVSSGGDSGTTLTSPTEGEVLAAPAELASGRGSVVDATSGSGSEWVANVGPVELPQSMTAGEELSAEGTSDAVNTSHTNSAQESAAETASSQTSTGGILQHTSPSGSNNSVAVPTLGGAGVGCIPGDPAQASPVLIEAVVANYLSFAVAAAVTVAVAATLPAAPAPDEVPGNRLEPQASSSALEDKQEEASSATEKGVDPPESLPGSGDMPHVKDADGDDIEEGPGEDAKGNSMPGSQISVKARTLVDEVVASSLVAVAAIVTARARDKTYACAPPALANGIGDASASLCKPSLEDKCPTEGTQTPRMTHSGSTSPASVSSQDRDKRIEDELSSSISHEAGPLLTRDLADGDDFMGHEASQDETALTPKSEESTPKSVSEPRVGVTDNGSMDPSTKQDDLPAAAVASAPETDFHSRPSASTVVDGDDCVTNMDKGQIDGERSIPDPPISAETRIAAEYLEHVVTEAVTAVRRAQGVGETSSDTSGSSSITAQVHSPREAQHPVVLIASEEGPLGIPATSAEVVDGEKIPTDADAAPAAGTLNGQQLVSDGGNPSLRSSDSSRASAPADSLEDASGAVAAAGGAAVLDTAIRSVHSEPLENGDKRLAGVSGADSIEEQREVSAVPSVAEQAASPAAAAPRPDDDDDGAADPSTPVTIESAANVHPLLTGQELPADPPLPSSSLGDPSCSSTLLTDSSEGGDVHSPETPTTITVHGAAAEEARVGSHASDSPSSLASIRCRVVADYLTDKLHETLAVETAPQVSSSRAYYVSLKS